MCLSPRTCRSIAKYTHSHCLNDEDEESNTALHMASEAGHLQVVNALIEMGADKEARSATWWMPATAESHQRHFIPLTPSYHDGIVREIAIGLV